MRLKYRWMVAVLVALLAGCTATGCGTVGKIVGGIGGIFTPNRQNDYGQMHRTLDERFIRYEKEIDKVTEWTTQRPEGAPLDSKGPWRVRRENIVTDPQWNSIHAGVLNVNAFNKSVKDDMDAWGTTGVRPAMLTPHADALKKAMEDVIALVKVVKP